MARLLKLNELFCAMEFMTFYFEGAWMVVAEWGMLTMED